MTGSTWPEHDVDVSVVVPCLNEAHNLSALLRLLDRAAARYAGRVEVLVVDGGSSDDTGIRSRDARCPHVAHLAVMRTQASRARQMNLGAEAARGRVLYFVHADTRPPLGCIEAVADAVASGARLGTFATEFDGQRELLRFNAYLTTFNVLATRGGDQSIFVTSDTFRALGGYAPQMPIMEEYDLMRRAAREGIARVLLPGATLVSDRKYDGRSWARVQLANVVAVAMWRCACAGQSIARRYARLLGEPKRI